jgi:hypothetical protein
VITTVVLLAALVGCTSELAAPPQSATLGPVTSVTSKTIVPPPSPVPAADRACPYLDKTFVAEANGQRVGRVSVSADKPNPACFFYRSDGTMQLTVQVYVGDPRTAKALVDQAAPVATSNHADSPAGWTGGAQATDNGAVYAVAKAGAAVVVTTNQAQTIKARRMTERVIATLAL